MHSELRYSDLERLLIEHCQAGTFITTIDGKLVDCNQALAEIFGYDSKDEILKVNAIAFYSSKSDREIYLNELLMNGKVRKYVVKALKKNGELIYHSINSDLYLDEDGHRFVVGSILDVTESLLSKIELKNSEKRYKDLFENSLDLIQSIDKNGRLVFCNSVWHEKMEYSKGDLKTLNLFDLIAEEYKNHCSMIFQEVMSGKSKRDVEVVFISKSGKRLLLEGNIVPIFIGQELKSTHAFFRDVSEKSLAREKIREQEQLLQTIFNTVPICLYVKDDKGRYLVSNSTMNSTLGCNVSGQHDSELFPKANFNQLRSTDEKAIENPDELINYEIEVSLPDEQKNFFCGKKAIFNSNSGKYNLFGFSVDVTDLKNSSRKIEESESLLQYAVSNMEGGFLLFERDDKDGMFLLRYQNTIANSLFPPHQINADFATLFHFIPPDEQGRILSSQNSESKSLTFEWNRFGAAHEKVQFFQIRFARILDINPKIIVNIKDVTEEKQLIDELEKNLKTNEVLIGEVHHRVKNNLAIIDGILELKKHKIDDPSLQKNLFDIQSRIKSIALVHEKLYQSENFSEVKIIDYLNELANHYKRMFDSGKTNQITFRLSIDKGITLEMSKSISFGLLLSELISNSCKYAVVDNKVEIHVSLEKLNDVFLLRYRDTGKQWNYGIKNLKQGGFGLRLIENLVNQLKGEYALSNSSDFFFELKFQA